MTRREAAVEATAVHLRTRWREALEAYRRSDTERNREAEQDAYDELVDYVEAFGLNYTEHDPR